jgi:GTP pyrophosphokinase
VTVDRVEDCYRVLGVIHASWRAVPGRFKDYISTPKQNNYQSLHTTIVGPRNQRVELQIRTHDMHRVAEYGIAAHALYKDRISHDARPVPQPLAVGVSPPKDNPYIWLRRLVDALLEGSNPEEFLEHTKLELFHDQVFAFTPKGRIIALPRGATPIDFAYAVHTDVGNSCVGATINGRQMPMSTALRNGDEVQILTAPGQTPPAAWEHVAVTGRARSAVRRATRDAMKRQYGALGSRLVHAAAERAKLDYNDDKLRRAAAKLAHKSVEDVYAAVGRGAMTPHDVLTQVFPDAEVQKPGPAAKPPNRYQRAQQEEGWFNLAKVIGLKFRWPGSGQTGQAAESSNGKAAPAIPLRGARSDVPVIYEEGGAVPGDRIVGVLSGDEGIRIFQIHSPRLKAYEHERWIDVTWDIDPDKPERFPARIAVTLQNLPGTLAQVAKVIGEADGNIDNLRMTTRAADFTEMTIEIEVWDLTHLNEIIARVRELPVTSKVERLFE